MRASLKVRRGDASKDVRGALEGAFRARLSARREGVEGVLEGTFEGPCLRMC